MITSAADRRAFHGCFEQAGGFGQPTFNVLRSDCLRPLPAAVRKDPEDWGGKKARQRLEADLTGRIAAAQGYEVDCVNAIDASGIAAAKDAAQERAREIHSLLSKIRKHPPQTMTGVLILARAVTLFEEAQRGNYDGGE
ncbi:hypothetical protein AAFG13_17065 [Bradyrhizobium sp. B124]|uniref:hypothetical protein n=1 Tax=Bradyrhizobium sp. B124 TaxID=3140245 RepID=UPI003184680C